MRVIYFVLLLNLFIIYEGYAIKGTLLEAFAMILK